MEHDRESSDRLRARNRDVAGAASDEGVAEDVCNAIFAADVDAAFIDVEVEDGVVTLRGEVSDQTSAHHIQQLLFDVPGVRTINNELQVVPQPLSTSDPVQPTAPSSAASSTSSEDEPHTSRLLRGAT